MKKMMPTTLGRQSTMPAYAKGDTVVTEEEMWANYEYFIKAVLPTAEEAGVRLALHPDDPPVPMLGGVARLFYKPADFKKAYKIAGGEPELGARPLPRLLLGDARRQGERAAR